MVKIKLTPLRIASFFLLISFGLFGVFIIINPVDWQQPETLRLRYYHLQEGIRGGPLTSGFVRNDFLKPLSNKGWGGSYEARYFSYLIAQIRTRIYQKLFRIFGPFLEEPLNLLLILITAVFLILAVKEWFSSLPAALVSAGAWLLTSQVLLDARYPIRPNMVLATALSIYLFWELLRLRRLQRGTAPIIRICIALFLACGSQEQALSLYPALGLLVLWERKAFARHFRALIIGAGVTLLLYIAYFWVITPLAMKYLINEEPLLFQLQDASPLLLLKPVVLFRRFFDLTIPGISQFAGLNLGFSPMISVWKRLIGGAAAITLLAVLLPRGRKAVILSLAVSGVFFLFTSMVMFPFTPSCEEMPVYYYALAGALFIFPLGAMLSRLNRRSVWFASCGLILIIGILNMNIGGAIMDEMPGSFGFNDETRGYVRDVLSLGKNISPAKVPGAVYLSYPGPRRFDISTRWDYMLRVWHGEAPRVFALLVPALYLHDYETGRFRGNPDEFSAVRASSLDDREISGLADLPKRRWYDLRKIRSSLINPDSAPVWHSKENGIVHGEMLASTMLGTAYRSRLPGGQYRVHIRFPDYSFPDPVMLFLIRSDLQAAGSDDIYYRDQPEPEGECDLTIRTGEETGMIIHSYGWNYQIHLIPVKDKIKDISVEIRTDGETELIGPVLLPEDHLIFNSWSR